MNCPKCGSCQHVRFGNAHGRQRYRCSSCGRQFIEHQKQRGVCTAFKQLALFLYGHCGVSMGNIAKIFGVTTVAVLKWIRAYGESLSTQSSANRNTKDTPHEKTEQRHDLPQKQVPRVVMIDEMWHFVNGKKTLFGSGEPLMGYLVNLWDTDWEIVVIPRSNNL
jgi:transposase